MDRFEELVISGNLYRDASPSPPRSRSPSPFTDSEDDLFPSLSRSPSPEPTGPAQQSIGVGVPGRTGVKGVIRDHAEARSIERDRRSREVNEKNQRMEKSALLASSYREEQEDEKRALEQEEERLVEERRRWRMKEMMNRKEEARAKGRFGHLREVGLEGFVQAVEETGETAVVVHLFDAMVDRCTALDNTLASLARTYPKTKFLRARAAALGFASLFSPSSAPFDPTTALDYSAEEEDEFQEEDEVDLDMLPTMLVYRGGELVETWVRVDWEAKGAGGVEQLLIKHGVVSNSLSGWDERQDEDDAFDWDD